MATLEEITKDLDAAKVNFDNFVQNIGNFSLDGVINKFKTFTGQMSKSMNDLNSSIQGNDRMTQSFEKMTTGLGKLITLTSNFDAFKNLSVQGGLATSTVAEQFNLLVTRFGSVEKAADKLAGKVSAPFAAALRGGEAATKAYLEHVASAEQLENVYLSLAGTTGQLGKEFSDLAGLDNRIARFNVILQDSAAQSNKTLAEVSQYAAALGTIPGTMDSVVNTTNSSEDSLNTLTASLRLASGAGKDVKEVISAMSTAYEKLGNPQGQVSDNAQKGAQLFALMSEASQKLNLRFSDTQGYLTHVAEQFKNIGDNTQGATNILSRFTGALQGTGLTAKASVEIVQNMVDSIKNLETGTKALISARSGGPGGLQGAFQVDNLIRQGKVDEVAKMMEQTLRKQFNGRIYTQEEAGNSPQAAAQFMRQRTMLQSGAFGGLARDNESATRLLEALKAGPGNAGPTISALMAVKDTAGHGNELQERQFTELNKLNSSADRVVSILEQGFKIGARETIGTTGEGRNNLLDYRSKATDASTTATRVKEPFDYNEYAKRQTSQGMKDFASGTGDIVSKVGNQAATAAKEAMSGVKDAIGGVSELNKSHQQRQTLQTDIMNSQRAAQRGNQNIKMATAQVMQQAPITLAAQIPQNNDVMKHEVEVKPLEVNIQVTRDRDTEVTTTTNYPNATVRNIVNQSIKGYENVNR